MTKPSSLDVRGLDPTSRRVLRTVLQFGPIARSDVAERTDLSTGSLTRLTKPLLEAGFLREGVPLGSAFGRPSIPLELVDESAEFLGVKVVPDEIHAVVIGLAGQVHASTLLETDTADPAALAAALGRLHRNWQEAHGVSGIGVALAGSVDPFGTVRAASFLGWEETNFSAMVSEATGLPCTTANDVDALALAQHWLGVGRGIENFVTLTIGSGVGAGAVVGGHLLIGHQGFSSLVGDLWASTGRTFHEELSDEGLAAAIARVGRDQAMAGGVARAAELVAFAKRVWGPQRILLTGEGVGLVAERPDAFKRALARFSPPGIERPELVVRKLEFSDWARGAAALAISHALRL